MDLPTLKNKVKKFTLDSFQRFCWTSSLIEDEFEAIVSKFFDCASAELFNDEIILIDDEGRTRWARTEEINYFLDYVSSEYLGLNEVKLEERKMDLSALTKVELPKKVVQAIEEDLKFYSGVLEILDHDIHSLSKKSSSVMNYLYLCIRDNDRRLSFLIDVDWIDYLSESKEDLGTIHVSRLHASDFRIFKKLLPELSEAL